MKSHEYAEKLIDAAVALLKRPEFEVANDPHFYQGYYDKEKFLAAARALGSGKKEFTSDLYSELRFKPDAVAGMALTIPRDKVCRKVRDEEWECESMLSPDEVESLKASEGGSPQIVETEKDGIPF